MDSFKLFRRYWNTLESQIQNLTRDHSRRRPRSTAKGRDRFEQTFGWKSVASRDDLKGQCQKRIAGEYRHRFAELFMARRFSATEVIVVHRRQIVVD